MLPAPEGRQKEARRGVLHRGSASAAPPGLGNRVVVSGPHGSRRVGYPLSALRACEVDTQARVEGGRSLRLTPMGHRPRGFHPRLVTLGLFEVLPRLPLHQTETLPEFSRI
jgi:hypothetical protein